MDFGCDTCILEYNGNKKNYNMNNHVILGV